ncbi:DUF2834 domain-containing protein [Sinimarinibacterium flocculans]|uniref:DUF2834 domain-containing protein n=1 Tax=Sinimarinibacterium flocculans TaxID=985250 RepID=UPI00248FDDBC|nr:DUF2834 domain-containing protein [Sinimarinibacterium flocculans]
MSVREAVYGVLAVVAAVWGWYYNLQYLQQPDAGWIDWIRQCLVNDAATVALIDLTAAYVLVNLWMVFEALRLDMRGSLVLVPATVFVSLGFGLGLFLLLRERRLRAQRTAVPAVAA